MTARPVSARLTGLAMRFPAWTALALGLLSATGFQPLGLWPLALLAMGLFAWLLPQTGSLKQAAWLGWLFGWGHFPLGNSWIRTAFTYPAWRNIAGSVSRPGAMSDGPPTPVKTVPPFGTRNAICPVIKL